MTTLFFIIIIMEVKSILEKLWFEEKEVNIYIANLKLGISTAWSIARCANINRTTTYPILSKLEKKWIIKSFEKNKVRYFEAIEPKKLYNMFDDYLKNLKEKLSELEAINNKSSIKPKIYYFEWLDGMKSIYEIEAKDLPNSVYVFSANVERTEWEINEIRKIRNSIYKKLRDKRPFLKIILNRDLKENEKNWNKWKFIKINSQELEIKSTIKIYNNKVIFLSFKKPYTWIVIENEDIAYTMKEIFSFIEKVV